MSYSSLQGARIERQANVEASLSEVARTGQVVAAARGGFGSGGVGIVGLVPEVDGGILVIYDEDGNRIDNTQFYRPDLDPAGSKPLKAI